MSQVRKVGGGGILHWFPHSEKWGANAPSALPPVLPPLFSVLNWVFSQIRPRLRVTAGVLLGGCSDTLITPGSAYVAD